MKSARLLLGTLLLWILLQPLTVLACSSPNMIYNSTAGIMEWCNGANWLSAKHHRYSKQTNLPHHGLELESNQRLGQLRQQDRGHRRRRRRLSCSAVTCNSGRVITPLAGAAAAIRKLSM